MAKKKAAAPTTIKSRPDRSRIGAKLRAEIAAREAREPGSASGYRIAKNTGLSDVRVYRFLRGEGAAVSLETLDKLLAFLGWDVGPVKPGGKGGRR